MRGQVFRRPSAAVATGRAGHRKPRSDLAVQHPALRTLEPLPRLRLMRDNIFGRASKPCSHLLYGSTLAAKIDKANLQFKDIDGTVMLELRIGGGGKGSQSVFPGSTHTSGEAIEWARDGELVTVDDDELLRQMHRLATAVMLARHCPCGDGASWVWACEYLRLLRVMLSKMTDNVLPRLLHFFIGILETFIGGNAHRLEVKIKQGIVTIPHRRVFHGSNDPPRLLG
jgi:hypothetical protein